MVVVTRPSLEAAALLRVLVRELVLVLNQEMEECCENDAEGYRL